ncbi:hypothetical protein PEBR_19385 [Penicillium brasilianum]|uniref:Uncharacterized protein n=1 Tax=Penicillium brasilianum TaxID=104259 RepID=A0A1S9RN76_PENBI|nr:hypothetical protein PEBR_19385 [Penicillium brasilianum]
MANTISPQASAYIQTYTTMPLSPAAIEEVEAAYPDLGVRRVDRDWANNIHQQLDVCSELMQIISVIQQVEATGDAESVADLAGLRIMLQVAQDELVELGMEVRVLSSRYQLMLLEVRDRMEFMVLQDNSHQPVCPCRACREEGFFYWEPWGHLELLDLWMLDKEQMEGEDEEEAEFTEGEEVEDGGQ